MDLYTKPTDTHQYLLPNSCHPKHCTAAIPCSLALHRRRICSTDATLQKRIEELKQHPHHRGYRQEQLELQTLKTIAITREEALRP